MAQETSDSLSDRGIVMDAILKAERADMRSRSASTVAVFSVVIAAAAVGLAAYTFFGSGAVPHILPVGPNTATASVGAPSAAPGPSLFPSQPAAASGGDIRILTAEDGSNYAIDGEGNAFAFNEAGVPTLISNSDLPENLRDTAAEAGGVSAAGMTRAADQRRTQAAQASQIDSGALKINALLAQPDVARKYLAAINRVAGVTVPGDIASGEFPVTIFYDPRCPYCHALFEQMDGKISARWVAVTALGDGSRSPASYILGDVAAAQTNADGDIQAVTLSDDARRIERLRSVMTEGVSGAGMNPDEAQTFAMDEAMVILRQLYGDQQSMLAVPTVLVPKRDGTATVYRGADASTVSEIAEMTRAYSGAEESGQF